MDLSQWNIDTAHSGINFSVRHMVISKVRGRFAKWSGSVNLADDLAKASVAVSIDAASIDTGVPDRDAHLRSGDFLDAEKYPALLFRSRKIERQGDKVSRVVGDLTIRDVTREVTLDVEEGGRAKDPWGNERIGLCARTSLDRKEFGLKWNQVLEAGGLLIGDRVDVDIEIEAVKK
ncbi:MAG: YceI family protein [Deltaproteobacteria bacterium]|nr:YceI family protein [Deltaproteobacteria bacterium]